MSSSGGNLAYDMVLAVQYQLTRTLIALAEDSTAIAVAPEWGDDYTLFSGTIDPTARLGNLDDLRRLPGVDASVAQVTRSKAGGAGFLGDRSPKVIQTLANWLVAGIRDPKTCQQAQLVFIANQKVDPRNWVCLLSAANRGAQRNRLDISAELERFLKDLEENYRKGKIPEAAKIWFNRFFVDAVDQRPVTKKDRIQVLSRVRLRDEQVDGGKSLRSVMNLPSTIPDSEYNDAMVGWFTRRCVNAWLRGNIALITKDELAVASRNTLRRLESRKARERPTREVLSAAATPEALRAAKSKPFMRLLGEIGILPDSSAGLNQLHQYLCFGEERARLAAENVQFAPYLAVLRNRWKDFHLNATAFAELSAEPANLQGEGNPSVKLGRDIYKLTLNPDYHPELAGLPTAEGYMRDGAYQHLADRIDDRPREAVWWLPDPKRNGDLFEPIGMDPTAEGLIAPAGDGDVEPA